MQTELKIHDCIQGSDEWFKARIGKITASHFSDVLAKKTGKPKASDYIMRLIGERLTGLKEPNFHNDYMDNGIETEAQAREYYESLYGVKVEQVGFVELNENVGCSPDGLVNGDGLIEIKCPKSTTHLTTILDNKMQTCYTAQVQGQLWVTGRQWCDWISFDPRVTVNPFFMVRVDRDEKYIAVLEAAVEQFIKDMEIIIAKLTKPNF